MKTFSPYWWYQQLKRTIWFAEFSDDAISVSNLAPSRHPLDDLNCQKRLATNKATFFLVCGRMLVVDTNRFLQQSDEKARPRFMSLNEQRRLPQALPSLKALCGQSHCVAAQQMRNTQGHQRYLCVCKPAAQTPVFWMNLIFYNTFSLYIKCECVVLKSWGYAEK